MFSNTAQHRRLSVRPKTPTIGALSATKDEEKPNSAEALEAATAPLAAEPERQYSATDYETDEEPESESDEVADVPAPVSNHQGPNPNAFTQAPPVPQILNPAPPTQPVRAIITVHCIRYHQGAVLTQPLPVEAGIAVNMRIMWDVVHFYRFRSEDPETAFLKKKPIRWQFSIDADTNTGFQERFEARCSQEADPDQVYTVFWDRLEKIMDEVKVYHEMMADAGTPSADEVVNGKVFMFYS